MSLRPPRITVTCNGAPIAELRPIPPRRFVSRAVIAESSRRAPRASTSPGFAPISTPSPIPTPMSAPTRGRLTRRWWSTMTWWTRPRCRTNRDLGHHGRGTGCRPTRHGRQRRTSASAGPSATVTLSSDLHHTDRRHSRALYCGEGGIVLMDMSCATFHVPSTFFHTVRKRSRSFPVPSAPRPLICTSPVS